MFFRLNFVLLGVLEKVLRFFIYLYRSEAPILFFTAYVPFCETILSM